MEKPLWSAQTFHPPCCVILPVILFGPFLPVVVHAAVWERPAMLVAALKVEAGREAGLEEELTELLTNRPVIRIPRTVQTDGGWSARTPDVVPTAGDRRGIKLLDRTAIITFLRDVHARMQGQSPFLELADRLQVQGDGLGDEQWWGDLLDRVLVIARTIEHEATMDNTTEAYWQVARVVVKEKLPWRWAVPLYVAAAWDGHERAHRWLEQDGPRASLDDMLRFYLTRHSYWKELVLVTDRIKKGEWPVHGVGLEDPGPVQRVEPPANDDSAQFV